MAALEYAFLSVIAVSLISLIGIFTLSLNQKRLRSHLVFLVAFAAGALFGDVFIHLLPESVEELGFGIEVSLTVLAGIVVMFIIEKVIHWRHCHYPHEDHKHPFVWVNLVGDAFHNFLDGIIIAAAYLISIPAGIATTIAVALHEIPQEIGDFGILLHGGFKVNEALKINLFTALTSLFGVFLVFGLGAIAEGLSVWLVPFAAGNFLYIAGSDLIPELHKEVKWNVSLVQLGFFLLGVGIMVVLLALG
ncbi:MAG: ZIP family metal transporter [Candidatus Diapherotrites archaeon]|nr:ZIP family metal transporter [Candidatus Diapherotrites archaeon]MDZ4256144.1 ZIP family metal transporter [archaeon]